MLLGRPDSRMWCLCVIVRDSWVWVKQEALYTNISPHKVGEDTLTAIEPLIVQILPVAFGPE